MSGDLVIKNPVLLVGIGSAGSKIATAVRAALDCKCLLISNDKKDLIQNGKCNSVFVETAGWINPSSYKLRSFVQSHYDKILSMMDGFSTVIVISSLAGRAGTAMTPLICKMVHKLSTVISIAIMPFMFEKNRIFTSGIALRRVRDASHSTIVVDNDAFLDNNPELSKEECFSITNKAIVEVVSSITDCGIRPEMNILCTSKANPIAESSLRDSISMLYDEVTDTSKVRRAMLYVVGGDNVPIGDLNKLVKNIQGIFKEDDTTEVAMSTLVSDGGGVRIHLVASAPQKTRFDRYDPIGEIIPDALDWDEPDSAPDIPLAIRSIE